jgi:hypothetical protein
MMRAEQPSVAPCRLKNPRLPTGAPASQPERTKSSEFAFGRADWTLFRSLSTLSQKVGVPVQPKLALGKLADDALDPGGNVSVRHWRNAGAPDQTAPEHACERA